MENYTWNNLLFMADILVQKGCLTENQLELIINLVDLKKLVKNNSLSKEFINNWVECNHSRMIANPKISHNTI